MQMPDTLLLTLSSNARVVNSQHYGPLTLKCRSYLDRLELILTPAPDADFKKNIPVAPRGLTRGLFPGNHHDYRSMYIKARRQEDGTYLAVVPRDEELGHFSYYYDNRTRASERADEDYATDFCSYEE
jgi:hypothetical protein